MARLELFEKRVCAATEAPVTVYAASRPWTSDLRLSSSAAYLYWLRLDLTWVVNQAAASAAAPSPALRCAGLRSVSGAVGRNESSIFSRAR